MGMNWENEAKTFPVTKKMVKEAFRQVKANRGSAGVDGESIQEFETNLSANLYRIWNRMTSGSYFPPPVREKEIPKGDGKKKRTLGIPTVGDRVAQAVVKNHLEKEMDKQFHPDSYGYRAGKQAHQAVEKAMQICWKKDWVIDLDIKSFFDEINHELLMKALLKHTDEKWVQVYVERWLKAPMMTEAGEEKRRDSGTPQGGVISPLLANLFLHYTFDMWMQKHHMGVEFERFADDIIVHCQSLEEAERLLKAIEERMHACGLRLSPEKTKIVYCKDSNRKGDYENVSFKFLGFTFKPRKAMDKQKKIFSSFSPGVSKEAKAKVGQKLSKKRYVRMTGLKLEDLAKDINPIMRGWYNYFSKFKKSAMNGVMYSLNRMLVRWCKRKYRKSTKEALEWLIKMARTRPKLFHHWTVGYSPAPSLIGRSTGRAV